MFLYSVFIVFPFLNTITPLLLCLFSNDIPNKEITVTFCFDVIYVFLWDYFYTWALHCFGSRGGISCFDFNLESSYNSYLTVLLFWGQTVQISPNEEVCLFGSTVDCIVIVMLFTNIFVVFFWGSNFVIL